MSRRCKILLKGLRENPSLNEKIFELVDKGIAKNGPKESYIQITINNRHIQDCPVFWLEKEDSNFAKEFCKKIPAFDPREYTMVIVVDTENNEIMGQLIKRKEPFSKK